MKVNWCKPVQNGRHSRNWDNEPKTHNLFSNKYVASDIFTTFTHASISNFSVVIQNTKTQIKEYSTAQIFTVTGSFNNDQYTQRRNYRFMRFNPKLIKTQVRSATKYWGVVGPVKRGDFIAKHQWWWVLKLNYLGKLTSISMICRPLHVIMLTQ